MQLRRVLSAVDAAWIVAGSMVGAGIFITPGIVAGRLPGVLWPLAAWVLGGLVALAGALVYGELGARIPEAGGDYRYIEATYGPLTAFVNGWAAITLTFSAAAAAQARSAMEYLLGAVLEGDSARAAAWAAPCVVLLLTWANTIGARVAGRTTVLLTGGPIALLAVIFAVGLLGGSAELHWPESPFALPPEPLLGALGAAIIPIFFTYSGWNAAAYLGGEMRDSARGLARGLVAGTGAVTLLYLAVNAALLLMLPQATLGGSNRPAAEAAGLLLGPTGELLLGLTIAAAILSSANVTLMAGARVYYAMAVDGMAPAPLSRVGRSGVPTTALWIGGIWSAVLSAVGEIRELVEWATLAILLLSSVTVTALFVLRRRGGPAPAFHCPGYPLTPALYLAAAFGASAASYLFAPASALAGLAILSAGVPAYFVCRRWFRK